MKFTRCFMLILIALFVSVSIHSKANAYFFDEDKTLEMKGKVQMRASWRTADPVGFDTIPGAGGVPKGNLVQQRNIALIELNHILSRQTDTAPDVKYHIVGRFLYEGVYDYGPQEFKNVRAANQDVIDRFKKDGDLWEAYIDYGKGAGFLRVGRQNLSWGETDIFQLLDRINPIDNTFGGSFEDLDDRRIPIWMVRGTYNLGRVGPISSLTLEGFFNPGFTNQKVAPVAPYGTPYAYPLPPPSWNPPLVIHKLEETLDNSRAGVRIQGVLSDNFNIALAHYNTIGDSPAYIITFDPTRPATNIVQQDMIYRTEQITGASLNFFESHLDGVIRAEVAWFWNEPVFIPAINAPILFGNFASGTIPDKQVLRYMVGFDKNFWFRLINDKSMINFFLQYFAEYYPDYDERQKLALPRWPTGEFVYQPRYDQKITLIAYTSYMEGKLSPQLAVAYDPRGALMYIPSLEYAFDPWRLKVAYYGICGADDVSVGIMHDREQASVMLSLLF